MKRIDIEKVIPSDRDERNQNHGKIVFDPIFDQQASELFSY